jgi:hypothetical protein
MVMGSEWTLLNDTLVSRLTMAVVQWKFCSFGNDGDYCGARVALAQGKLKVSERTFPH